MVSYLKNKWIGFWMQFNPTTPVGRISCFFASLAVPPYKSRCFLANYNHQGYIAPTAGIKHDNLVFGGNVFIGDRVIIYQAKGGGGVELNKGVQLYSDIIIETGNKGSIKIGKETHIQPRCQLMAYAGSLTIGCRVEIAPNCAFYPYDHSFLPGKRIRYQPAKTKGGIFVGDDSWIGVGVIVLDGVRIGEGAVVGAGSVVTSDIPDNAIAVGVPARVIKMRIDLKNDKL